MADSKENSGWQRGFDSGSGAIGEFLGHMGIAGVVITFTWFLLTVLWGMISLVRKTDEINDFYKDKSKKPSQS